MTEQVIETKEPIATENTQSPEKSQEETPEQINWKKFREGREQDRKAKELAEREAAKKAEEVSALKAAMEAIVNKGAQQATVPEPEDVSEDQRIQKLVDTAMEARDRKARQEREKQDQVELPIRLSKAYNDFDAVCSTENLDYLEYHYPEVATPYKYLEDNFDKWSQIYKAVKRFVPNPDSGRDKLKAEKNNMKPQSMSVGGTTKTADSAPAILDDQRRAANWQRMQRTLKGIK